MSANKDKTVEPMSSITSPKSIVSESKTLHDEIRETFTKYYTNGVSKGKNVAVFTEDNLNALVDRLEIVLGDNRKHSVPTSALLELQSQLSSTRLQLSLYKDDAEKAAHAEKILTNDLVRYRAEVDGLKKDLESFRKSSEAEQKELKSQVALKQAELKELKASSSKSKVPEGTDTIDSAEPRKQLVAREITELNNALQANNKVVVDMKNRISRYEHQILTLTNEANIQRAKLEVGSGPTFASVVRDAGLASVDLRNRISSHLSKKSKEFLSKASGLGQEDTKSKAFWLRVCVDNSKHALLKPYKIFLGGLDDDIKRLGFESRKRFEPVLDAMIASLEGKTPLMSQDELDDLFSQLDTRKLFLKKSEQKTGVKTLKDFIDREASNVSLKEVKRVVDFDKMTPEEQAIYVDLMDGSSDSDGNDLDLLESDPMLPTEAGGGKGGKPTKPNKISYYQRLRAMVVKRYFKLKESLKPKDSEGERPSIKWSNWLVEKAGFLGKVLSLPIKFFSFLSFQLW